MAKMLLVNDFVDPLGWLKGACIDAKVTGVQPEDGDLLIELSDQYQTVTITLSQNHLKTLNLSQVAKILSEFRGNYLLRALAYRIEDD